jgi:uncharacterized membrane protein YebE (DUF533 family)
MFDAKKLLGDFISGQVQKKMGGSFGGTSGGFGGGGGIGDLSRMLGGGTGAAMAGGLASLILGSKKGRKLGGSAIKLGGLALVGSLAYQAYRDWQAGQGAQAAPAGGAAAPGGSFLGAAGTSPFAAGTPPEPPRGTPFAPANEADEQALSRNLLRAMIAAAKADGHIDAAEQAAIFGEMDKLALDQEDKAFVMDELRAPLDVDAVARAARSPEEAAALYAASLLVIDVDHAAERGYLAMLAARLRLDDALVAQLHAKVDEAAPAAA